jgi:hypothetical protein
MNSPEREPTLQSGWDSQLSHRLKSWVNAHPKAPEARQRLLAVAGGRKSRRVGFFFEILRVFTQRRPGDLQLGRGLLYTSDLWLFRTLPNSAPMHPGWVLCS